MKTQNTQAVTATPATFDHSAKRFYTDELAKLDTTGESRLFVRLFDEGGSTTKHFCVNAESVEAIGDFLAKVETLDTRTQKTHLIEVRYLAPTNCRGSRVQFRTFDASHYKNGKAHTVTVGFDYEFNTTIDQGEAVLKRAGFKLVGVNAQGPSVFFSARWDFDTLAKFFKVTNRIDLNTL